MVPPYGPKGPIPVVINADDFGYSGAVNAAIAEAMNRGCISSATIMANAEATDDAIGLSQHFPEASFGVHLNLTEFRPLLPSHEVDNSGLVNQEGCFLGNGFRQLRPSPQLLELCFRELNLQLIHVLKKGIRPSHLDSHHHVHTIPWLLPVLTVLQKKYKIPYLRNTMNVYPHCQTTRPSAKLIAGKRLWQLTTKAVGSHMTQRFTSLQIFMDDPLRSEFTKAHSIELMCHPGQKGFEAETEQLLRQGAKVLPHQYQLRSYKTIFHPYISAKHS